MSYNLINFLIKLTENYMIGNFIASIISNKYNKKITVFVYLGISVLYYYSIDLVLNIFKNAYSHNSLIKLFFCIIIHLILPFVLSTDNKKVSIYNGLLTILLLLFYDISMSIIFYKFSGQIPDSMVTDNFRLIIHIIGNAYLFILSIVFIFLFYIKRGIVKDKSTLFIILVPFGQMFMLISLFIISYKDISYNLIVTGNLIMIFLIFTDTVCCRAIYRSIDNYALKEKIEYINLKNKYEVSYYKLAMDKYSEISKIRHDFNNQLQSIYAILTYDDEKSKETAKKMLQELVDDINEIKKIRYSNNETINTILAVKSEVASKKNIPTHIEVSSFCDTKIKDIHLCSIYSNLYDNAIEACEKVTKVNPYIQINAGVKSNYVIIKFVNTYEKDVRYNEDNDIITVKSNNQHHGIGLKCVKDIVLTYDGHMKINHENNLFSVIIIIPL